MEFLDRFSYKSPTQNFAALRPVETALTQTDRQNYRRTDMTKLIGVLSEYAKAPKMSNGIFKQNHGLELREKWRYLTEPPHFNGRDPPSYHKYIINDISTSPIDCTVLSSGIDVSLKKREYF